MNGIARRMRLLVVPALLAAATCAPDEGPAGLAGLEAVDLTHVLNQETIYWPSPPAEFVHEELAYGITEKGYFYSAYEFSTPEHGGTHIDAPIHFAQDGQAVDEIPLSSLIAPAVVIDVTKQAADNPDYRISVADVEAFEAEFGRIPEGAAVLARTGWSRLWPDKLSYLGDDEPGAVDDLHFPGFGAEAARFLVEQRGVGLLGIDTASIDHGPSPDFPAHRALAEHNVPGLENLTNLGAVPPTGAWLLALPAKIAGGSGAPVRAVALVRPSTSQVTK